MLATMPARNADLEAEIIADPCSSAAYLVYADWLLSRDDPRGELILLQHALETERGARWAELKAQESELVVGFEERVCRAAGLRESQVLCTWRRGFVDRVAFHDERHGDHQAVLSEPSLAFVRTIINLAIDEARAAAVPLLFEHAARYPDWPLALAPSELRHIEVAGYRLAAPAPGERSATAARIETLWIDGVNARPHGQESARLPALRLTRAPWPDEEPARDALLSLVASTPHVDHEADLSPAFNRATLAGKLRQLQDPSIGPLVRGLHLGAPTVADLHGAQTATPRLQRLHLENIGAWTPAHIAELPIAPELCELSLGKEASSMDEEFRPDALAMLATLPCAATIQRLRVGLADPRRLRTGGRAAFPAVRVLELRGQPGVAPPDPDLSGLEEVFPALEVIITCRRLVRALSVSALAAKVHTLVIFGWWEPEELRSSILPRLSRFRSLRVLQLASVPFRLPPPLLRDLGATGLSIEVGRHDPQIPPGALRTFEPIFAKPRPVSRTSGLTSR